MRKLILDGLKVGESLGRHDSNETAVFRRQMEHIYAQTYDTLFQDYKFRQFLAINHEVPNWAQFHTFRERTRIGKVQRVANGGPSDYPKVEIEGKETTAKLFKWGASFGYSIDEMRASAALGTGLEQARANAVREAMEDKFDSIACVGDTESGLVGLANVSGITNASTAVTANWSLAATAVGTILSDLASWQNAQRQAAGNLDSLTADTLLLTTAAYNRLATTYVASAFASDLTVLQFILKGNIWIKRIECWPTLDTADGFSGPRCLLYKASPDVAEMVIPQEFEMDAPQLEGRSYQVLCEAKTGGVKSVRPIGISYSDVAGG